MIELLKSLSRGLSFSPSVFETKELHIGGYLWPIMQSCFVTLLLLFLLSLHQLCGVRSPVFLQAGLC